MTRLKYFTDEELEAGKMPQEPLPDWACHMAIRNPYPVLVEIIDVVYREASRDGGIDTPSIVEVLDEVLHFLETLERKIGGKIDAPL